MKKPFWRSKTIWGGIISISVPLLTVAGVCFTENRLPSQQEVFALAVSAFGLEETVRGRLRIQELPKSLRTFD
jgi:hypothetical protein